MDLTIQPRREPNYAPYQKEIFLLSQKGSKPEFNTHPDRLEELAKEKLTQGGWLYASCNAGLGWTDRANREGESSRIESPYIRLRQLPSILCDYDGWGGGTS